MERLKDYFDCSLFNQALSRPLDYEGLLEKEGATKEIDVCSNDWHRVIIGIPEGIIVKGRKNQYWLGRNLSIDEYIKDSYNYEVKITQYDDSIFVEVEADVDRYVGSSYWDMINLPTYQIATIPKENGRYHISFEEYYSLKDDVLVHETGLSDKVEVYMVPSEFKLGDAFKDNERFVFKCETVQEEVKKLKQNNIDE